MNLRIYKTLLILLLGVFFIGLLLTASGMISLTGLKVLNTSTSWRVPVMNTHPVPTSTSTGWWSSIPTPPIIPTWQVIPTQGSTPTP